MPVPGSRGANGPTPSPPSRLGCSRRSPESKESAGAKVASTFSPPTLPATSTRGSTATVYAVWAEPVRSRTSSVIRCSRSRSSTPDTVASPSVNRCSAASGRIRSQPRPSLILASSAIRPPAVTGSSDSSRYVKLTRRRWTRRWKTGSPVLTWPSGYAALLGTRASYSNRPWCAYAASTVSVAVSGRLKETKASPTHATAATPRPISSGFSSSGTLRGARGAGARRGCRARLRAAANGGARAEPAAEGDQRDETDEEGAVQRLAQPLRHPADGRCGRPEAADDLLLGRMLRVEEVVVVALEHEVAVLRRGRSGAGPSSRARGCRRGRRRPRDRRSACGRPRGRLDGAWAPSSCRR